MPVVKVKKTRLCRNCSHFRQGKRVSSCRMVGRIRVPDYPFCSWYREKKKKQ